MAKQEEGFGFWRTLTNIIDFPGKVKEFVSSTEEKLVSMFYSASVLIAGLIFISLSCVFLINQYLVLSMGWSFMIIGLILIIVSLVIKSRASDNKMRGR